ncbi:hypothetical protein ACFVV7_37070 [Streptomyces globisporus]|uniref:hypothetical protein n=1 Tax=Streptomyces globisporus TaxID=1908 RepID=UPI0036D9EE6F
MREIVEYHWVLTLRGTAWPDHRQVNMSANGLYNVVPGETTRKEVCDELIADFQSKHLRMTGEPLHDPKILAFVLQPNQL